MTVSTLAHRSAAHLFPLSLVLLLALILATPPTEPAHTSQSADLPYRLELRAQVGGSVNAIAEDGGVVYLGMGPRVMAVDVSDPTRPHWLGQSGVLPGVVRDLAFARDHVYAVYRDSMPMIGRDGLAVLNVVDPRRPQVVGLMPLDIVPHAVAIGDGHAYVVGNRLGSGGSDEADHVLLAVNVIDPARPQVVARRHIDEPNVVPLEPTPMDIAVAGGRAIVVHTLLNTFTPATGIRAYDLWNPADPVLIGKGSAPGEPRALAVDATGRRLFVVGKVTSVSQDRLTESIALQAMDVTGTDIASFTKLGELGLETAKGCGGALAVRGDRVVYVDRCTGRLHVVDANDPARLRETYAGPSGTPGAAAAWAGRYCFVAGGAGGGMAVFDLADPDQPVVAAELPALGAVQRLAWHAETLYATDPQVGLWAIGTASIAGEAWLAPPRSDLPEARDAVVAGGRLFVAAADPPGIHAFALDSPDRPRRLEPFPLTAVPEVLAAAGDRLYASFGDQNFTALSAGADGLHPLGEAVLAAANGQFAVDGDAGRVIAQTSSGFAVLSGSDLNVLREVKEPQNQPDFSPADSMATKGGMVYLAVASYGFEVFRSGIKDRILALDIESEESAQIRARRDGLIGDKAGRLLARDGRVAVSGSRQTTLLAMPVGGSPEILAAWASPGTGADLVWEGTRLYLADGEGGLCVLDLVEATVPTAVPSATSPPLPTRTPTPVPTPIPTAVRVDTAYLPYAARGHAPKDIRARFSLANQIGGPTWAMTAAGDRLYRAEGPHVVVLDASDPSALRELGRSEVLPGMVVGLAVAGNTLLAAVNDGALYTLDIGDPGDPQTRARLALPDWPRDVVVGEGVAYVAAGEAGVLVVDISTPAQPRIITGIQPEGAVVKVRYDQQRIYAVAIGGPAAASEEAVHVIDVHDPFQPRSIATLGQEYPAGGRLAVVEGRLFANNGSFFDVYDVSRPAAPVRLDDWSEALSTLVIDFGGNGYFRLLEAVGSHLVIVDDKLLIVDISGPAPPTTAGVAELPGDTMTLAMTDRLVFTQHPYGQVPHDPGDFGAPVGNGALAVTDIRDPAQPHPLSIYHGPPSAGELFLVGDILVLAAELGNDPSLAPLGQADGPADLTSPPRGPFAVDISDPERPRRLGFVAELAGLVDLEVEGTRGFATFASRHDQDELSSLVALDLADPLAPKQLGALDLIGFGTNIAMSGTRIYRLVPSANGRAVVEVFDVADPAHMRRLGSADIGPAMWSDLAAYAGIVYWPRGEEHPAVALDLTDPAHPGPPVELPFPALDMEVAGDQAYVVSQSSEGAVLAIYDLLDPTAPRAISTTPVCPGLVAGAYSRSLLVTPESLVLIGGTQAVCTMDAADPARPRMVAGIGLPAYVRGYESYISRVGLAWAKGHAFVEYIGPEGSGGSGFLGLASLRLDR